MDGEVSAGGNDVDDGLDIAEVQLGVDTLGIELQSESDQVDASCAFAVAEETALDTITAREKTKLASSHTLA